ncbi:MAG: YraN family protein [Ignavibacteriae bacterium]|nr:YraN family protein [Ignavibacteriota bacterium]
MKIFSKKALGDYGEAEAKNFLKSNGLKFIESNYKYKNKEIDLIFCDKKNKIIIFVEVKTRTGKDFGEPERAINRDKQMNVRSAARVFVSQNDEFEEYDMRFDSVSVFMGSGKPEINHIENAF